MNIMKLILHIDKNPEVVTKKDSNIIMLKIQKVLVRNHFISTIRVINRITHLKFLEKKAI